MSSDSEDEDAFLLPKRNGRALSVSDSSEEEDLSGGATTMDAIEVRTKKSSKAFAEKAPTAIAGTKEVRTAMYEAFKFTIDTSTPVFAKIFDPATDESKKDFDKRLHKAEAELIDPNDAKTSSTIDAMENLVFACSAVFHVCELINLSTATAVDMVVGFIHTEYGKPNFPAKLLDFLLETKTTYFKTRECAKLDTYMPGLDEVKKKYMDAVDTRSPFDSDGATSFLVLVAYAHLPVEFNIPKFIMEHQAHAMLENGGSLAWLTFGSIVPTKTFLAGTSLGLGIKNKKTFLLSALRAKDNVPFHLLMKTAYGTLVTNLIEETYGRNKTKDVTKIEYHRKTVVAFLKETKGKSRSQIAVYLGLDFWSFQWTKRFNSTYKPHLQENYPCADKLWTEDKGLDRDGIKKVRYMEVRQIKSFCNRIIDKSKNASPKSILKGSPTESKSGNSTLSKGTSTSKTKESGSKRSSPSTSNQSTPEQKQRSSVQNLRTTDFNAVGSVQRAIDTGIEKATKSLLAKVEKLEETFNSIEKRFDIKAVDELLLKLKSMNSDGGNQSSYKEKINGLFNRLSKEVKDISKVVEDGKAVNDCAHVTFVTRIEQELDAIKIQYEKTNDAIKSEAADEVTTARQTSTFRSKTMADIRDLKVECSEIVAAGELLTKVVSTNRLAINSLACSDAIHEHGNDSQATMQLAADWLFEQTRAGIIESEFPKTRFGQFTPGSVPYAVADIAMEAPSETRIIVKWQGVEENDSEENDSEENDNEEDDNLDSEAKTEEDGEEKDNEEKDNEEKDNEEKDEEDKGEEAIEPETLAVENATKPTEDPDDKEVVNETTKNATPVTSEGGKRKGEFHHRSLRSAKLTKYAK